MNTVAVKIKGCKESEGKIDSSKVEEIDNREIIYVGRTCKRGVNNWQLESSIFKNPFSSKKDGLVECIRKYINHIFLLLEDEENLREFMEMKGKALACWCKPKLCHADVLCYILDNSDEDLIDIDDVINHFDNVTREAEEEEEKRRLLQERIDESKGLPITLEKIIVERISESRSRNSYTVAQLKSICRMLDIQFKSKDKKKDLFETLDAYDLVELIRKRIYQ